MVDLRVGSTAAMKVDLKAETMVDLKDKQRVGSTAEMRVDETALMAAIDGCDEGWLDG